MQPAKADSAMRNILTYANSTHLADIESVINLDLEGTHDDLVNQGRVDLRLLVKQGLKCCHMFPDELRLVVSRRSKRSDSQTANGLMRRDDRISV